MPVDVWLQIYIMLVDAGAKYHHERRTEEIGCTVRVVCGLERVMLFDLLEQDGNACRWSAIGGLDSLTKKKRALLADERVRAISCGHSWCDAPT